MIKLRAVQTGIPGHIDWKAASRWFSGVRKVQMQDDALVHFLRSKSTQAFVPIFTYQPNIVKREFRNFLVSWSDFE